MVDILIQIYYLRYLMQFCESLPYLPVAYAYVVVEFGIATLFVDDFKVTLEVLTTSRKTVFYNNFVSTWTHDFKHSCHIGPFSYYIGHFLSFWTMSQKTMFSTSEPI